MGTPKHNNSLLNIKSNSGKSEYSLSAPLSHSRQLVVEYLPYFTVALSDNAIKYRIFDPDRLTM